MKTKPLFSIVIPTYNGKKLLDDCLESIKNQSLKDFEVILVDNGSTDQTSKLARKYKWIHYFNLKKPLGFAKPVNFGIKKSKGKYIFLLNNDVKLDKNCLEEIKIAFDKNKKADFAALLMLNWNGKKVDSAGDGFSWWGRAYPRGRGENPKNYQKDEYVFGACGGASVFKRKIFDNVGYLDEDFYAYFEDADLSFRAQLAGYRCLYISSAKVFHKGSSTFKKDSAKIRFIGNRNKDWVIFKNYPTKFLLTNLYKLMATKLKSMFTDLSDGLVLSSFRAIGASFVSIPKLMAKRTKIQKNIKVSDQYLLSIISKGHPKLK